jgi:hypothetical protein
VFRPTPQDVLRVTSGRSTSEPDPSLLYGPFSYSAVQSYNPACSTTLSSIGSGSSPLVKPETANDVEVAYGHRFSSTVLFQGDVYSSRELNPLVSGVFPLSVVPGGQALTAAQLQQYLNKLNGPCGGGYTAADLGITTTFNAGSATYRGIALNTTIGIARNLKADVNYDVQSAAYNGIPDSILKNNVTLINGAQMFIPENAFGHDANSFQQGTEQFGLPYRQMTLSFTMRT